jgi:flagellar hook-length control protein FliK
LPVADEALALVDRLNPQTGERPQVDDARETLLSDSAAPLAGILVPVTTAAITTAAIRQPGSPVLKAESSRVSEGIKSDPVVSDHPDRNIPKLKATLPDFDRVADSAAGGKMLPQLGAGKSAEGLNVSGLPTEPQRLLEIPVNTLPSAMMSASHPSVMETKVALPQATLQVPVGTTGWGESLGQKVVWMAGQQTQVAELHLNPPNLGPMEVRISVSSDQVSALFVSHQPAVREAIEAAMPRLREMLADSGMTLGNATVSSDSLPQQQSSGHEGQPGSSRQSGFSVIGSMLPSQNMGGVISLRHDGSGMVDLFA